MKTNLILSFISVLLILLVLAIGLQLIDKPKVPVTIVGWTAIVDDRVNQLGFRGQMIDYNSDDLVILLVGDSQVETVYTVPDSMPEYLLQEKLKLRGIKSKVFTIGSSGYGNDQQFLHFNRYFSEYRADYVFLWQTFGNDIWNNVWPTHWPKDGSPKPTFTMQNDQLTGPNYNIGDTLFQSRSSRFNILNIFKRLKSSTNGLDEAWTKNLPESYIDFKSSNEFKEEDYLIDLNLKDDDYKNENLFTEKSHLAIGLIPRSPRMEYGIKLTNKLITEMENLSLENKSKFIILDFYTSEDVQNLDTIIYVKNSEMYLYSNSMVLENKMMVNEKFNQFKFEITWPDYKVSDSDPHLNVETYSKALDSLASFIIKDYYEN